MNRETKSIQYDADIYFYIGEVSKQGYNQLRKILERKDKEKKGNCCFVPVTRGGSGKAAFRIARILKEHYGHVDMLIIDICKSAGTILCIGADRLIFDDHGELGPVDVQIPDPHKGMGRKSGQELNHAMAELNGHMRGIFNSNLEVLLSSHEINFRLAADIAVKLTKVVIGPMAAQINPSTLGIDGRAMEVAMEYGKILNDKTQSLHPRALDRLNDHYPTHGFVIDRDEAKKIFKNIVTPRQAMGDLYDKKFEPLKEYLRDNHSYIQGENPLVMQWPEEEEGRDNGESHEHNTGDSSQAVVRALEHRYGQINQNSAIELAT